MYLTWSAMTNNIECNPSITSILKGNSGNSSSSHDNDKLATFDWKSVIGLAIWFIAILYARLVYMSVIKVLFLSLQRKKTYATILASKNFSPLLFYKLLQFT